MKNDLQSASDATDGMVALAADTLLEVSSTVACSVTVHKDNRSSTTFLAATGTTAVPVEAGSRIILRWVNATHGHIVLRPIDGLSELHSAAV